MVHSMQDSLFQEARRGGVVEADPLDHAGRVAAAYLVNSVFRLGDRLWEILLPCCPSRRQTQLVN